MIMMMRNTITTILQLTEPSLPQMEMTSNMNGKVANHNNQLLKNGVVTHKHLPMIGVKTKTLDTHKTNTGTNQLNHNNSTTVVTNNLTNQLLEVSNTITLL